MKYYVYISDAAVRLNRTIGTLRKWDRTEFLPEHLRPARGERNRRYWTEDQIEQILVWMVEEDVRPGKGLPHNSERPSEEEVARQIRNLRKPKRAPA